MEAICRADAYHAETREDRYPDWADHYIRVLGWTVDEFYSDRRGTCDK